MTDEPNRIKRELQLAFVSAARLGDSRVLFEVDG